MKKKLGGINVLYPTVTTMAGAVVHGKPNFNTIAHVGIMNHAIPYCISLSMAKIHYTNIGIRENKTFSVCLPSENLVVETDYCGIMTGKKTDKAALFDVFYGELKTAPMIQECSVCMECRLDRIVDFPTHDVFIGDVVVCLKILDNTIGNCGVEPFVNEAFPITKNEFTGPAQRQSHIRGCHGHSRRRCVGGSSPASRSDILMHRK